MAKNINVAELIELYRAAQENLRTVQANIESLRDSIEKVHFDRECPFRSGQEVIILTPERVAQATCIHAFSSFYGEDAGSRAKMFTVHWTAVFLQNGKKNLMVRIDAGNYKDAGVDQTTGLRVIKVDMPFSRGSASILQSSDGAGEAAVARKL
jgi:hypothetical protein